MCQSFQKLKYRRVHIHAISINFNTTKFTNRRKKTKQLLIPNTHEKYRYTYFIDPLNITPHLHLVQMDV